MSADGTNGQHNAGGITEESREIWDTNADAWDARMSSGGGFQTILIEPTASRMLDIKPGERVLDIACGNGIFSRHLAKLGAEVVAADFSPRLIELARQRTTENTERISYHVADATDETQLLALAGGDGQLFDAVVCNNAIMDMPEIEPLFRAVARLLKPEGRFVFTVLHPCFNGLAISLMAELPDYATEATYSIKVSAYLSAKVTKGMAIDTQPRQQYYWHRPLHELLNAAFACGLVMDRLEEPPYCPEKPRTGGLNWADLDMPPLLFARLRPQK